MFLWEIHSSNFSSDTPYVSLIPSSLELFLLPIFGTDDGKNLSVFNNKLKFSFTFSVTSSPSTMYCISKYQFFVSSIDSLENIYS